jgi:regulator of sirC expression with transglutaminase-like and TPR domain
MSASGHKGAAKGMSADAATGAWFAATGPDRDLFEAALRIAACDHPGRDLAPYRAHLAELAADAVAFGGRTAETQAAALAGSLAGKHGYRGDAETYDDLANANLIDVIDRRRGLPVALGILYIAVARAAGWQMEGLAFPHHFLTRIEAEGRRAIVDPFAGALVDTPRLRELLRSLGGPQAELSPAHTAAASDRAVLMRLVNNQRLRLQAAGRNEESLAVVERMLWLSPADAGLVAEAAEIEVGLGRIGGAIRRLDALAAMTADGALKRRLAEDAARLRLRLN